MKRKNIDMTNGEIYSLLIAFAVPLLLGDLFQQLYNMVDTWVIGNFATNSEYAAVGACTHILNVVIKSSVGLSSGIGVIIARRFGSKDKAKLKTSVDSAVFIAICFSVIFTIVGILIIPYALSLTKVPEDIYHYAEKYLTIVFSFVASQVIYNIGSAILRSVGDSVKPVTFLVIASITNVVLDLYLVKGLGLGIVGVAYATVISQCLSALLVVIELFTNKLGIKINMRDFKAKKSVCLDMIRLGTPTALQMGITAVSNVFIQSYINGLGVDFLSGFSTFNKVEQIFFLSGTSMGIACMTFVSQNLGAGDKERAKKGINASIVLLCGYSIAIMIIVLIFAHPIAAFFNPKPDVIKYGTLALRLISPFYVFQGTGSILMNAFRGCGNTKTPLYFQLIFNVLSRQIYLAIISRIVYTPVSILLAQPISWIAIFLSMYIAFKKSTLITGESI